MAVDHHKTVLPDMDIEQAYGVLKKGSHLLKYRRRGKPKFCPFRLSNDESTLIWYSGRKERHIKLSNVLRIIPGQRTAVFKRYPRPEKDYQSFSLILPDRSLDLICKDREEADVWFVALQTILSRYCKQKSEISDLVLPVLPDSPRPLVRKDSSSISSIVSKNDEGNTQGVQAPLEKISDNDLEIISPNKNSCTAETKSCNQGEPVSNHFTPSPVAFTDNSAAQSSTVEAARDSLSSCVSSSSQGSSHDDQFDELGDVFIWGEGAGDGMLGGGMHKVGSLLSSKIDAFLPKALTSTVILHVHSIACGSRHAVLVTKQGEIFSWGEEAGGQLGHGPEANICHPKLIHTLSGLNVESVACGEQHTCAVTLSGDLYTWGDGIHNSGLLGHGGEVSHWTPTRVLRGLDGIQISFVACGPWHTAAVSSAGKLFTFGDGSFGALGHGDHSSTKIPREVEALGGLRATRVACGFWHTAAAIEETNEESPDSLHSDCTSRGKLFTWGDGNKGQLGHGDKESRLSPEFVTTLDDENICQVACGYSVTVALTSSGRVYTMGSDSYGQLGNPEAKGEVPTHVSDNIADNFVEEISCGYYHVAIRTSKPEVYTWGRGGNGQLGHGDNSDKHTPTLVDFLKDKQIRSVSCGSNFTTAICLNEGLSGSDDSVCSACYNPFGFLRKCHNCYNCGLVFCSTCSSKKSMNASLAPDNYKPYRVCDDCFTKLKKAKGSSSAVETPTGADENKENQGHISQYSSFLSSGLAKRRNFSLDMKLELGDFRITSHLNERSLLGGFPSTTSIFSALGSKKLPSTSVPNSKTTPRETSRDSRSATSTPRTYTPHRSAVLNKEVIFLRTQVEDLTRKSHQLEAELEKTSKQLKEVTAVAADEAEKCISANKVVRSLTAQLVEVTGRVPQEYTDYFGEDSEDLPVATNESHATNRLSSSSETSSNSESRISSNGNKARDEEAESKAQTENTEWVLHDQPGVYITFASLPGGGNEIKRIRFGRRYFSREQAEKWWTEHGPEICEQYHAQC